MKKLYKVIVGKKRGPYVHVYEIIRETEKSYYLGGNLGYVQKTTKSCFTSLRQAEAQLKKLIQRKVDRLQAAMERISLILTPSKMAVDALEEGSSDDVIENLLDKAEILKVTKVRKTKPKNRVRTNYNGSTVTANERRRLREHLRRAQAAIDATNQE